MARGAWKTYGAQYLVNLALVVTAKLDGYPTVEEAEAAFEEVWFPYDVSH